MNNDGLFHRVGVQGGIDNCGAPVFSNVPQRIEDKLIKHLSGKWLLPQVSVFGIQNRFELAAPEDGKVWPRWSGPSVLWILVRIVREHSTKPMFVLDFVTKQVLPQEAGHERLEESIHIEKEATEIQVR